MTRKKKLLAAIVAIAVVLLVCVIVVSGWSANSSEQDVHASNTVSASKQNGANESEIIADNEISDISTHHYGDTLYQYDGKTVVYDYYGEEDEYVTSITHSQIVTYQDTVPVHVCRVNGNGSYHSQGEILKLSVGVDTVKYKLKQLPESVSPELALVPSGFNRHFYAKSFALPQSWDCCFKFRAYLPDSVPAWTKQYIATIMGNDIQSQHSKEDLKTNLLKEYYSIKSKPHRLHGIDASQMSPKQIANHFSKKSEQLYKKVNGTDHCPKFDYLFEMFPAWQSSDGKYITYRFYIYTYAMGAHGYMKEYYLTFNNKTGDILGFDDLFYKKDSEKVWEMLTKQITEYNAYDGNFQAGIKKGEICVSEIIKEEKGDSRYYPRPALTKEGVVFSYQPYEIAAFSEGVRHFAVPYNKLKLKIKR